MLFNSIDFLLFFGVVFTIYWSIPSRWLNARNGLILVSSYFFYGYWDWRFLGLIAISTLLDFVAGLQIHQNNNQAKKRVWLWASIMVNLGILGFFKYFNFFADSLSRVLSVAGIEANYVLLEIILPVGISFYTFQTLSYTIDIYRGSLKPTRNLLQFAAFVAFFPQLVAGPIERAKSLLPQFQTGKTFSYGQARFGAVLMLYGFFKKVVIADNLARYVDPIFMWPEQFGGWEIFLAFFAFTIQLYTDFSGYSDIAIGLAAVFGFRLSTNFSTPFFSRSIREFWQRWHISLSTWFRDYVFIPLGGSRGSRTKTFWAITITFLVSGLWHGAAWQFVVWGGIHAAFYQIEKLFPQKVSRWAGMVFTFLLVVAAFVFFRSQSLTDVFVLFGRAFSEPASGLWMFKRIDGVLIFSMLLFTAVEWSIRRFENYSAWLFTQRKPIAYLLIYVLLFYTVMFGVYETGQNFIYFAF